VCASPTGSDGSARGYGLADRRAGRALTLDIMDPPRGFNGFVPMKPLVTVEHAFVRPRRCRRLPAELRGKGRVRRGAAR
jgi:hypothetical protein